MKRTWAMAALLLLSVCAQLNAQHVAYDKYKLPNDLTVILHEDHSLPVACVNLWVRVGSKDEVLGRSGFAHLFEHLMFMGTKRVAGSDFDNFMEAGGGWNNASTSEDRTNYYSMGPAELLPTLLWLEADRLEALGKEMTAEKLDKQRAVVRNERRQTSENVPYGKARLRVSEMMYPKGHPYRIPVIGTHEDLEAATLQDVKDFFAMYYVPSNISLVVAGDFDPAKIKPLINQLFGTLPRGSDVVHAKASPVKLSEVKRITLTDTVQFPRIQFVYHSPATFTPGDAEMDLAGEILSSGISSRLYQKLIYQEKLAVSVSAFQSSSLLGSLFMVSATVKPEVSLDKVEELMDGVLAEFVEQGPTEEELERQKAQYEFSAVSSLQSLLTKADQLNRYEFYFGEPDSFKRALDRYRNATVDGIKRHSKSVLTPDARLVMRVIPEIKTPEVDPIDQRPTVANAASFSPPEPTVFKLSNGVKVYHWPKSELPLVSVRLMLPFGAAIDPSKSLGLASLAVDMLDEGAGNRTAVEFADALDTLGASIYAGVDQETTTVVMSALKRNLKPALSLFADAILRPRFDKVEWERVQRLRIDQLKRALDQPGFVALQVAMRTFFGDDHPYGRNEEGTPASVGRLALSQVKTQYGKLFQPTDAVLFIAGDLTSNEAKRLLEDALGQWSSSSATPLSQPSFRKPSRDQQKVVIVDRPDAVQTVIRFVMPGPNYADPRRVPLGLFNTILGGSFTSRLNQNLREEKGYTYGARSGFTMESSAGYFTASSSVRADVTGASISEFLKEFAQIRGGDISSTEAGKARATQRRAMMERFQGLSGTLSAAANLIRHGRTFSAMGEDLTQIAQVKANDLNKIAYDAIPLDKSVLVLVGDKHSILKQIAGLGLPDPIEMTATGDLVH